MESVALRLYDRIVFRDTYWQFLSDQHWAVIGANGAGKSTLMRALCGNLPVVAGRIVYHYAAPSANPQSLVRPDAGDRPEDRIAYVSFGNQGMAQRPLAPFYQARWNVGVTDARTTVRDTLSQRAVRHINPYQVVQKPPDPAAYATHGRRVIELLGIEDLVPKDIVQLSDGERRKVSLARALLREPQLLILDNPLTGLDAHYRVRLMEIIERLMQADMRVIVVTARDDEIPPGVTHVLQVHNSQVMAQGPREDIYRERPAHVDLEHQSPASSLFQLPATEPAQRGEGVPQVLVDMRRVDIRYGEIKILEGVDWTVANDHRMIELMAAMKADEVVGEAQQYGNACGAGAIAATIAACSRLGATAGHCLWYTNSYEIMQALYPGRGDDTTVGYASVVFA